MENMPNLSKIVQSINDILVEHDTKASDIPESLIAYAIINDAPYMIEDFIEDGFVALNSDSPFGWMKI